MILNYTTKIPVDKTIGEIQKILIAHGATGVLAEAENGQITVLSFKIVLDGQTVGFKLPNEWKAVLHILNNSKKVPRAMKTQEQALRVSWRILKDWVEAQMALIETKMVKMEQVFLPYAISADGKTLFEKVNENKALFFKQG